MILDNDMPVIDMLQMMENASPGRGVTSADLEEILESELDTTSMLEYISAVLSNRMN